MHNTFLTHCSNSAERDNCVVSLEKSAISCSSCESGNGGYDIYVDRSSYALAELIVATLHNPNSKYNEESHKDSDQKESLFKKIMYNFLGGLLIIVFIALFFFLFKDSLLVNMIKRLFEKPKVYVPTPKMPIIPTYPSNEKTINFLEFKEWYDAVNKVSPFIMLENGNLDNFTQ